jgi:hypothetical protein
MNRLLFGQNLAETEKQFLPGMFKQQPNLDRHSSRVRPVTNICHLPNSFLYSMFTVFLSRRLVREEGHISCSFLTHDIGGKAGEVAWVRVKNYFLVPVKNKSLCPTGPMIVFEDSAAKLKRGHLNVCTVYDVCFSPLRLKFVRE